MKLTKNFENNIDFLKNTLVSEDVVFFDFDLKNKKAIVIYIDSIIDKHMLGLEVLKPLSQTTKETIEEIEKEIVSASAKTVEETDDIVNDVIGGSAIILINGFDKAISVDLKKYEIRAISESPTSMVVKGPRAGFNESIKTNLSQMRQRIKHKDFKIEMLNVGKYSNTSVAFIYISSIANESLVKKVRKRLKRIDIDGIPDSSYVAKFLSDHKGSLFKQVGSTEKPDILMAKLLEGRVGIMVDGSPFALTLPFVLIEDFQSSEDYFESPYRANMNRAVRVLALLFSIFLPSLFVSAQLFHLQLIPLNFLLTIVNSIKGIPLSPSFEMFFTLLMFEILNEASIRMPKYVGMALSVVGALVLGETAVNAGIVSTPTVLIMALSGIAPYTLPELNETISILRLVYLIFAGSVGGYGIMVFTTYLVCYLSCMDNFDTPYLSPYSPLILSDLKDGFYMNSVLEMQKRPKTFKTKNINRLKLKDKEDD